MSAQLKQTQQSYADPASIRAHVERVLASDQFSRCARMQRFLTFIVEEALAGRAGQLGEFNIAMAVFDRGVDFEPGLDPIVRNDARRLRMKLCEYYRRNDSAGIFIDVPKGGYAPVILPSHQTSRPCRIGVFPFEVLSPDPESKMHARALCLSITAQLTAVEGMQTIAHTLIAGREMQEAALGLNLTYAICGSVNGRGKIVNLIRLVDGVQLWACESQGDLSVANVVREVRERIGFPASRSLRLSKAA